MTSPPTRDFATPYKGNHAKSLAFSDEDLKKEIEELKDRKFIREIKERIEKALKEYSDFQEKLIPKIAKELEQPLEYVKMILIDGDDGCEGADEINNAFQTYIEEKQTELEKKYDLWEIEHEEDNVIISAGRLGYSIIYRFGEWEITSDEIDCKEATLTERQRLAREVERIIDEWYKEFQEKYKFPKGYIPYEKVLKLKQKLGLSGGGR